MKKIKPKILKSIKWCAIGMFGYWSISTLLFGYTDLNSKTGIYSFRWSGVRALFSEEDFGFTFDKPYKTNLNGIDGPYVFGDVAFLVNEEDQLIKTRINPDHPLKVKVNNSDQDTFEVLLKKDYKQEPEYYDMPDKLIAISDIEGNYNALYSFLLNNKVINKHYDWIFGKGHLVLNGDFFDRGVNVNQVLWLIYSLEEKAKKHGGKVHFINGNHETMNLYGDVSDVDMRYIEIAKQISNTTHWSEAVKQLYSKNSELGKWLRTKNVVEKIGNYIFVHGGLSKKHKDASLSIPDINRIAKTYYGKIPPAQALNTNEILVLGSPDSPYWDRSLSMNIMYKTVFFFNNIPAHKTTQHELDEVLKFYKAEKIVIGHSVVNNVTPDYNGKVLKIDVKHGTKKNSPKTQGLLVDNGMEYRVDSSGNKERL